MVADSVDVFVLCYSVISPLTFHSVGAKWFPLINQLFPFASILLVAITIPD